MTTSPPSPWHEINQRHLMAALARVRTALESRVSDHESEGTAADEVPQIAAPHEVEAGFSPPTALDTLCDAFGLSCFERDVVLLCAGPDLDSTFRELFAAAHGDPRRSHPTFGLALAALPSPHWSALSPARPLRRWQLVEMLPGDSLTVSPLRIDERVLHYLTGLSDLDERLLGMVELALPTDDLWAPYRTTVDRVTTAWSWSSADPLLLELRGDDCVALRAIAAAACAQLGLLLYVARAGDLPRAPAEREVLARLWEREALLSGSALLVEFEDGAETGVAFVDATRAPLLVSSRRPLRFGRRIALPVEVPLLSFAERRRVWEDHLGFTNPTLNGEVDAVAAQFHLDSHAVAAAVAQALAEGNEADACHGLWEACRAQARPRLDDLAERIEPRATWGDIVLPEPQIATLQSILLHVRHRTTVYESWGFEAKGARGLGLTALFCGPSGTGKTMAAEVLASELRLDLYHIDLSQVVSKYIGETEKNLCRIFDAADRGGSVLLFDEADALFGKRSEVKDSHDRYANIEISYLLQRMETYRGLAILTTNMKSALDSAFLRRLRFVVEFPFPNTEQRAEIWRRMFPASTPTEELDVETLARLDVSGGTIRNISLSAAFLAVAEGQPVRMGHLFRAARDEYMKLAKPLTAAEIGG